jgi:SET domain-containing protein
MRGDPAILGPRSLYLRSSPIHGLGVFAAVARQPGDLLEVSPVLVVPRTQVEALQKTSLHEYYFRWPPSAAALALGYGSLYNHSYHPTARAQLDVQRGVLLFIARQPIHRNQEVTINYNGDPTDLTPTWFDLDRRRYN